MLALTFRHRSVSESFTLEGNNQFWKDYTRYSAECWSCRMGDSDEPVYDKEEEQQLEALYQQWLAAGRPGDKK